MSEKVRFAPLVRVSTESQERRGQSLLVQKESLVKAVETLRGVIPDDCWEYSGQEHATSTFERQKFTKLMRDCSKDKFDAIIVYDPSRWSRDNRRSKEGLEILKSNGIRFFVGTTEYDLFNPQASLFLGMSTEMNEYFALEQSRKSILSRIDRAKKNRPTGGKLPFGRTFDKIGGKWGIDEQKRKDIVWAANQYLEGELLEKLAKTLGMNHSNLWKVLNHRSGTKWEIKFQDKKLQIDETVRLTIPELLPQETIDAIHQKGEFNKKFERSAIKNKYLLSRLVFCSECGYSWSGQASKTRRYYRHSRNNSECKQIKKAIPADILEEAVLFQIYSLFGDKEKLEQAILDATPDAKLRPNLEKQIKLLKNKLTGIKQKKRNLLNAVADGRVVDEDITEMMADFREQEQNLKNHISTNHKLIKRIPSAKELKKRSTFAQNVLRVIKERKLKSAEHLSEMSWEDKRRLIQIVLAGIDEDGGKNGVFVHRKNDKWHYEIRGSISGNINGIAPLNKFEIMDLLQIEPEEYDSQLDLLSKCDAHHCLCFYQ
ncbi:MAG: recombinase family protein [Desulfobulbia bacterium]